MTDPQTEHAKVRDARRKEIFEALAQAYEEGYDSFLGSVDMLSALADAVTSLIGRHDGDCQAFQHTYTASQGEPGVYPHGDRMVDVVGTNGRRLLVRDDPDGIYVGGAVLDTMSAIKLAAHLELLVQRRGGPR